MRVLFALAFLMCATGALPAWASSAKKSPAKEPSEHGEAEGKEERAPGTPTEPSLEMPGLVSPVNVEGELKSYVYLRVKLKLNDSGQRSTLLEKVPYIQDAFLRDVHGPSIALNNDPSVVDLVGLSARLLRVCDTVVGPGVIKAVDLQNATQDGN